MKQRISQEEAIRRLKREQLKTAPSLVVWGEYESHRTKDNPDLTREQRIFVTFPMRINKLPRYKEAA